MSTALTLTGWCVIFSFFVIATQAHDELEKRGHAANNGNGAHAIMASSRVTRTEKKKVLDIHNRARQDLGANNVLALEWDDELANLAQGLTDTCHYDHGNMVLRNGMGVAQNIGKGHSVASMVQKFIDEREFYNMHAEVPYCRKAKEECGHYVNAIWHSTNKIGCGKTQCPGQGLFLACNYKPGVQTGKPASFGGAPCSKCNLYPGTTCDDGICRTCTPGQRDCRRYDMTKCKDSNPYKHRINCEAMAQEGRCKSENLETICEKSCGICRAPAVWAD